MTLACTAKGLSRQDLEMILQSFREYSESRLTPAVLLDLDARNECPESIIREMCGPELGIQLVFLPEEYGGMGGSAYDVYRTCEALARLDVGVATGVLATLLGSDPLRFGTPEQKKLWLSKVAGGGHHGLRGHRAPGRQRPGRPAHGRGAGRGRREARRLPPDRQQAVDQQRRLRRRLHDPGERPRRTELVHRGEGPPRLHPREARGQARDPPQQHRRAFARQRLRAGGSAGGRCRGPGASTGPGRVRLHAAHGGRLRARRRLGRPRQGHPLLERRASRRGRRSPRSRATPTS